ncbi:MAG TPA: TrmH family RNA methyltransferase [Thermomicrobiales bacterium]|nr:TrmH family RNA methyltransferase [Thermomicrobiales bacterium]
MRQTWPRSTERVARLEQVLSRRQPDLTVVLEDVHDPHNAAAVLRSCDAAGVLGIHAVYDREPVPKKRLSRTSSSSASKWVGVERHETIDACYRALRAQGVQIVATALTDESVDLYSVDFTRPTAIVMGNEHRGLTAGAITAADLTVRIPMAGMVESLNISVAAAVSLFEAARQRREAGMYDTRQLSDEEYERVLADWLKR